MSGGEDGKDAVRDGAVHYVEHGRGRPVLVLHGASVDHREAEACFEPALSAHPDLRRIYPDLPGMGRTPAAPTLTSATDVLEVLDRFMDDLLDRQPVLLVGHSAGAYYAKGLAARRPRQVLGVALVCPLLTGTRDVPEHRPLVTMAEGGDAGFRDYFVIQSPGMLERYERYVAPSIALVDAAAMERIGQNWRLAEPDDVAPEQPTLIVAGRRDSTLGYAAAVDLWQECPRATLAVLDGAGHALPHEQPELLGALLEGWLDRATGAVSEW